MSEDDVCFECGQMNDVGEAMIESDRRARLNEVRTFAILLDGMVNAVDRGQILDASYFRRARDTYAVRIRSLEAEAR